MKNNVEDQANKEYRELLGERTKRVMQRDEELHKKNLPVGLDGPNYYQDIEDWFDSEFLKLKKKVKQTLDDESKVEWTIRIPCIDTRKDI